MTSSPAPPNRRRRRVVVVVAVLALVSMVSWWYWPRGDARFVGRWAVSDSASATPKMHFYLYANGRGVSRRPDGEFWTRYGWQADSSSVVIGVFPKWLDWVPAWLTEKIGIAANNHVWRVISAKPDEIILEDSLRDGAQIVLTRIPE